MLLAKVAKVGKELVRAAIWFSVGGCAGRYVALSRRMIQRVTVDDMFHPGDTLFTYLYLKKDVVSNALFSGVLSVVAGCYCRKRDLEATWFAVGGFVGMLVSKSRISRQLKYWEWAKAELSRMKTPYEPGLWWEEEVDGKMVQTCIGEKRFQNRAMKEMCLTSLVSGMLSAVAGCYCKDRPLLARVTKVGGIMMLMMNTYLPMMFYLIDDDD